MAGILTKTQIAICLSSILSFGSVGQCFAQSTVIPLIDTPTQRWLPAPKFFPNQPDSQAKLLSRLRDFVLSKDQSKNSNPSRLSNADIQTLKDAMKQFGGNLPDGLTADSLDAIPPDLISRALSDPELIRQAKELAEQFRKIDRPRSTDGSAKSSEGPDRELMEKLRSTQQQFERNRNQANESLPSMNPSSPSRFPKSRDKDAQNSGSKSGAKPSEIPPSESVPNSIQPSPNRVTKRPMPTPKGLQPSIDNPFNQRATQAERSGQFPNQTRTDSNPFESEQYQPTEQTASDQSSFLSNAIKDLAIEESLPDNSPNNGLAGNSSASGSSESKTTPSMDIRKELQRTGFGPTFKKLVEDAQRATQSAQASPQIRKGTDIIKPSIPPKTPTENTNKLASPDTAKRPPNPSSPNKSFIDTTPKPSKPDTAVTKSLQETGKYLNNLWTQIGKTDPSSTPPAAPPNSSPQASSASEVFSLPNPFNARVLEYVFVLAVAGLVVLFVLRHRIRSEQERREILEARMAPRIDEIRTRDDVVRAFHALAKQRLQSVQAWWTCGYVRERFSQTLPEHSGSIRTLSGLYEQARYFPVAHQLTEVQIEDAKHALKQCKG